MRRFRIYCGCSQNYNAKLSWATKANIATHLSSALLARNGQQGIQNVQSILRPLLHHQRHLVDLIVDSTCQTQVVYEHNRCDELRQS